MHQRLTIAAILMSLPLVVQAAAKPAPYGACAHLARGDEFGELVQELDLMKAAGIRWVRADFTWGYFEPKDNQFTFDRYDQVVQAALDRGGNILPILCYSSPWAGYAHENLDAWTRFVRKVVERYGDRLRYWEVWNEPNISFWKPKPNAAQYAALLKATYETIKAVDPNLQVMYGGTAGIPLKYIRETLELGAAKHFDVMAIHPYCYPSTIEASSRLNELAELKAMLKEFGATDRIWITETGWPTHKDKTVEDYMPLWESLVRAAGKRQFPGNARLRLAFVVDPDYTFGRKIALAAYKHFSKVDGFDCRKVTLAELAGVSPANTDVLMALFGEQFPKPYFDDMVAFVRKGGMFVHLAGVPLYYAADRVDGAWQKKPPFAGESYRQALHIGWEALWTKKGLPKEAKTTKAADGVEGIKLPKRLVTKRWFNDAALKPGDQFVPLLAGFNKDKFIGYPSALYLLRSDLKGAVLVNCLPKPQQRGVDYATQAAMLSRAYLTYLAHGIEVFLWYEFRNGGLKPDYNEHNFGMIDFHLKPKPAYHALKALTTLLGPRPKFDGPPKETQPGLMELRVAATDGRRFAVYWAIDGEKPVEVALEPRTIKSVRSHLGEPMPPNEAEGRIKQKVGLAPVFVELAR